MIEWLLLDPGIQPSSTNHKGSEQISQIKADAKIMMKYFPIRKCCFYEKNFTGVADCDEILFSRRKTNHRTETCWNPKIIFQNKWVLNFSFHSKTTTKIFWRRKFSWKSAIGNLKIHHWLRFEIQPLPLENDLMLPCLDLVCEQCGQGNGAGSLFGHVIAHLAFSACISDRKKSGAAGRIDQMGLPTWRFTSWRLALQFHWRSCKITYLLHTQTHGLI